MSASPHLRRPRRATGRGLAAAALGAVVVVPSLVVPAVLGAASAAPLGVSPRTVVAASGTANAGEPVSGAAALPPTPATRGDAAERASRSARPGLLGTTAIDGQSPRSRVLALQQRLRWAGIRTPGTGELDAGTVAAVRLWQAKRGLPVTGEAGPATLRSLATGTAGGDAVAPACRRGGVVICVDKTQKVLRYYRDGDLVRLLHVNVGPERGQKEFGQYSSTRVGTFRIQGKDEFKVSSLYGTPMAYFMPFDGGIAFHHSAYFDATGYAHSSYGCVTIASKADAAWLFDHASVGTRVVVHA